MKQPLVLLFFFLFGFGEMEAQFNNNYWVFGDSVGIDWSNTANPLFFNSKLKGRGTAVSLADSSGVLVYSGTGQKPNVIDRTRTFNRYHLEIPNSDSINGEGWYHEMLLIPHPGNDSIVYLFSIGVNTWHGLFFTLINYKANNDSGVVVQKNIQLQNTPAFDGLTAVRHGNGRDWWLMFKDFDPTFPYTLNNNFFVYLIDSSGVHFFQLQSSGSLNNDNLGQLIVNLDGSLFAIVTLGGLIELYNFDRCSGIISSSSNVEPFRSMNPYPYYFSAAFSPDDSKLYVVNIAYLNQPGQNDTLFQFDLTAPNISASKQVIAVLPSYERGAGNLKLAPDNKIYLTSGDQTASTPYPDTLFTTINSYLSVINQPDSLGLACDFQPFSFYLGGARTYYGLPNNPDYDLGAWVGSPCDTLTVSLSPNPSPEERGAIMQAWYNHEWNMIHVNASKLKEKYGVLRLFDVEGRVVYERKVEVISGGYFTTEIGMNGVASGVYIVSLTTEKDKLQGKILKF